jgi:hypothetical protein
LVLRNVNTGAFEVYDIAGNTLVGAASLGQVGLDWQFGGFAADPPTASMSNGSTTPPVQQWPASVTARPTTRMPSPSKQKHHDRRF